MMFKIYGLPRKEILKKKKYKGNANNKYKISLNCNFWPCNSKFKHYGPYKII